MGKKSGRDLSKIPIIVADINDDTSLLEMAKTAKVIVNCCGPYSLFGEPVVKACISASTHHVDVSGEAQYMEAIQLKYNDQARDKGIYVVSACGFDSIPQDLGTIFLQENFKGTVNSVESYLRSYMLNKFQPSGALINSGTWESVIRFLADGSKLYGVGPKLFPTPMPRFEPVLKECTVIHKSEVIGSCRRWCLPFFGADRAVVERSQRHFYENNNQRPVQTRPYFVFPSILHVIGVIFGAVFLAIMSKLSFTRELLLKHPKFFSLGIASHDGPNEETSEHSYFEMTFFGQGWKEKFSEHHETINKPTNKKMKVRVIGSNPGYGTTCVAVLLSAKMILKESSKMPGNGGVLPPGAAFKNTSLIKELQKNGFTFEVLDVEE